MRGCDKGRSISDFTCLINPHQRQTVGGGYDPEIDNQEEEEKVNTYFMPRQDREPLPNGTRFLRSWVLDGWSHRSGW